MSQIKGIVYGKYVGAFEKSFNKELEPWYL